MQCIAFYSYLTWFGLTNVIIGKLQRNAENTCRNDMCKRALRKTLKTSSKREMKQKQREKMKLTSEEIDEMEC
jgi:hypothetical protein